MHCAYVVLPLAPAVDRPSRRRRLSRRQLRRNQPYIPPIHPATWPRILDGRRICDLSPSSTPAITDNVALRLALRDDIYIDKRMDILTEGSVIATVSSRPVLGSTNDRQMSTIEGPAGPLVASMPCSFESGHGDLYSESINSPRRLQQNVVFHDPDGSPLLYSTFWWDSRVYEMLLETRKKHNSESTTSVSQVMPIDLEHARVEHSRRILSVVFGTIDQGTSTWGRQYVYKIRSKPFLVAEEVFAPAMERYLGEITQPLFF